MNPIWPLAVAGICVLAFSIIWLANVDAISDLFKSSARSFSVRPAKDRFNRGPLTVAGVGYMAFGVVLVVVAFVAKS